MLSSWIRTPSLTTAGSSAAPFRVTEWTVRVRASMKVDAPDVPENRTTVVLRKTSLPVVRSSVTS
jgi:hypothetical protein